jgi:hypothetical protein
MDTAPLPAIPAEPNGPYAEPNSPGVEPNGHDAPARMSGPARALEIIAGLASGGLVLLGLGLVVLQLIAPDIAPGTGQSAAAGPTWGRALAQLGVGAAGEFAVWARPWLGRGPRVWIAVAVLLATAVVLWLCWWR